MKNKTQFSIAIHLLLSLAYRKGEWQNSNELAKSIGGHPVAIRRLLSKLVKAGLVDSRAGREGGVRLAKDPENISVRDILVAADSADVIKLHESPKNKDCPVSCQIAKVMTYVSGEAQKAVNHAFRDLTLNKLLNAIR